jgi:hypothetical protein
MISKVFLLAMALVTIGVAIVPIGTDPWRRNWLSCITVVGGFIMLISAFRSPYRAGLPLADIFLILILFLVGLLSSGAVDYNFAGGDAFHSYRSFPFRWLVGSHNPDMNNAFEWSVFWQGY